MLHVRSVAGESLATIELASFSATLAAGISCPGTEATFAQLVRTAEVQATAGFLP